MTAFSSQLAFMATAQQLPCITRANPAIRQRVRCGRQTVDDRSRTHGTTITEDRSMNFSAYTMGTTLSVLLALGIAGVSAADIKPSAADNLAHATAINNAINGV